jgi:D-alanyl-D-alanine dipeptidase/carboxypeptidase
MMRTVVFKQEDMYTGPLALVNSQNPVRSERRLRLVPLDEDGDIFLEQNTASLLRKLFEAAGCAGRIVPVSGYRSCNEQRLIYINSLRDSGAVLTKKYIAMPECSEHQTGLAVDLAENSGPIDPICPSFPEDGICGSFRRRAAGYGFIERYGEDKEILTGIAHEPWHFRYVGYPHSMYMQENNLCLEEYIDVLRSYPYDGRHLVYGGTEVFFAGAALTGAGISLPEECTQVSGNNVDGFIATVWRRKP